MEPKKKVRRKRAARRTKGPLKADPKNFREVLIKPGDHYEELRDIEVRPLVHGPCKGGVCSQLRDKKETVGTVWMHIRRDNAIVLLRDIANALSPDDERLRSTQD